MKNKDPIPQSSIQQAYRKKEWAKKTAKYTRVLKKKRNRPITDYRELLSILRKGQWTSPPPDGKGPRQAGESLWALRKLVAVPMRGSITNDGQAGDTALSTLEMFFKANENKRLPKITGDLWPDTRSRNEFLTGVATRAPANAGCTSEKDIKSLHEKAIYVISQMVAHNPNIVRWAHAQADAVIPKVLPKKGICKEQFERPTSRTLISGDAGEKILFGERNWATPIRQLLAPTKSVEALFDDVLLANMEPKEAYVAETKKTREALKKVLIESSPFKLLSDDELLRSYGDLLGSEPALLTNYLEAHPEIEKVSDLYVYNRMYNKESMPLIHVLAEQRRYEDLERLFSSRVVYDTEKRDRYGQTPVHSCIFGLTAKTKKAAPDDVFGVEKWTFVDHEVMQSRVDDILKTLKVLEHHGFDLDATSSPDIDVRISKKTGKPVRTLKWPARAALPGETYSQQTGRLVKQGKLRPDTMGMFRGSQIKASVGEHRDALKSKKRRKQSKRGHAL